MQHVHKVLERIGSRGGYSRLILLHQVRQQWHQIVGPRLAKHSIPYLIKNQKLTVVVSGSAWLIELNFIRDELTKKINRLSKKPLRTIDFKNSQRLFEVLRNDVENQAPKRVTDKHELVRIDTGRLAKGANHLAPDIRNVFDSIFQKIKRRQEK